MEFHWRHLAAALTLTGATQLAPGLAAVQPAGAVCELSAPDVRWTERALEGWDLVRRDFLSLEAAPLPWIVLFDASCTWHIAGTDPRLLANATLITTRLTFAGEPVEIHAQRHSGTVLLPNRVEIPIGIKASTALYRNGRAAFVVMSLPDVWRSDREHAKNPHLEEYLQGVFSHEVTHTRQLVAINRRLRQLIRTADVPGRLNDDFIQERFQREPGFQKAVERERDLFFRAATETAPARQRDGAARALALARERHTRYFSNANAVYSEIEGLFMAMEGAGQWAAYRLAKARGLFAGSEDGVLKLVRNNRRYWSQDEGLALIMLLDALVPRWQERIFAAEPVSPFVLLDEALKE